VVRNRIACPDVHLQHARLTLGPQPRSPALTRRQRPDIARFRGATPWSATPIG
jgi:hypothetical protein